MKRALMSAAILAGALSAAVAAAPRFNALDASDPSYGEYQAALCAGARDNAARFAADRYWLDHRDPKMAAMSAQAREAWVVDYVITTQMRDAWADRVKANCP